MLPTPKRYEIDHRTIKLIVGVIALTLASVTDFLSHGTIDSISEAYHADEWARDVFVGSLYAIAAFLLAYNGQSTLEMVLSKLAAVAALFVAMFPCDCGGYPEIIPKVHGIAAAVMFLVLAALCRIFYVRAMAKGHPEARRRAVVYAACCAVILGAIAVLGLDHLLDGAISARLTRLTFIGERAGLVAFGVSWLFASRVLPYFTSKEERFSLLGESPAE